NTFIFFSKEIHEELIPYIRKIPAQSYLKHFYSDRSHMKNQITAAEYPLWPIINDGKKNCFPLADYLNIQKCLSHDGLLIKVDSLEAVKQGLT
ncbi:MAG: hypothetical protein DRQ43_10580, partial [Gammaproteobacteria bacterium]